MKHLGRLFVWVFSVCFFSTALFATPKNDTFKRYLNPVFVETGTCRGNSVIRALASGFETIHSIELSPRLYYFSSKAFAQNPNVTIHHGDSGKILYDVIKDIDQPITFWLDAHYSGGETERGDVMTPLLAELDQIKNHPMKNHTILIDDMRCCGTYDFEGLSKDRIIQKLLEINPEYQFTYEDGYVANDILVARVKK